MFGIGMPELIIILILFICILPTYFYLSTLKKALLKCSNENREMSPGLVWLFFIPIFNLGWHFYIVLKVAKSLKKELETRGINIDSMPGQSVGITMCVLTIFTALPLSIQPVITIAAIICWIIYWIKIAGFSSQLSSSHNS